MDYYFVVSAIIYMENKYLMGESNMTGTAVLYMADEKMLILRNIEKEVMEEIQSQCGHDQCICHVDEKEVNYGSVKYAMWMERVDIGD